MHIQEADRFRPNSGIQNSPKMSTVRVEIRLLRLAHGRTKSATAGVRESRNIKPANAQFFVATYARKAEKTRLEH